MLGHSFPTRRSSDLSGCIKTPATGDLATRLKVILDGLREVIASVEPDQVAIEKSMYLSLCRFHWEEETGSWPLAKPKAKPARAKAKKKVPRKKSPNLRLAAASTKRPARTRR